MAEKNYLIHTPEGVRDIYGAECRRKLAVQEKILQVLYSYGYEHIQTPSFEYFDIFSKDRGSVGQRELFKFFDRDNETLVLRPDMTPAVARFVAKYHCDDPMPLRLCYLERTFKNNSSYQGRLKERTETGAEMIGDDCADADAEMIAMVIDSLRAAGLQEFQVELGQVEFYRSLVDEAGLDEETQEALNHLIENKNNFGVEELLKDESGKVVGIRAGEDEITSQVVIVAEGTNTLLSERCLGNARPAPCQMAVGIKEVFELPAGVIEDRFLLPEGEGAAMLFVGDCTHGKVGGGFLYTNRDSISLGLVATISTAAGGGNDTPVYQMLEDFKGHPAVAPIIRGAKMVEHSGHMVPEGGYDMVPQYVFDGALLAGEAAGLCMNMGYQVRGMDFAVASGRMAAEAAVEAIDAGDASAAGLSGYARRLEDSFVIKDLKTFRKWPHVMEEWDAMFNDYPTMAAEVFNAMFSVDGRPQEPLRRRIMPIIKKRGLFKTANEVRKAVSAL